MCGRYASSRGAGELMIDFEIEQNDLDGDPGPSYNIAPTCTVPIILERLVPSAGADPEGADPEGADPEGADPEGADPVGLRSGGSDPVGAGLLGAGPAGVGPVGDSEPVRSLRRLRPVTWGLVPSWSRNRSGAVRMINARAETLLEKPAYRKAASTQRCLVPADGWYEWQVSPVARDGRGKPRKQPFFLHPADGGGLAFAGIYEFWRDRDLPVGHPQSWLVTFAVVTTAAEPGLALIHDRMPLVLPPERWDAWLDPLIREPEIVRTLIEPVRPGRFAAVPVTTRVNSVRNNGPELLLPAVQDQVIGALDPATGELIGPPESLTDPGAGRPGELF